MNNITVVLGASNKPDRYSYKAVASLQDKEYCVLPVHPKLKEIQGLKVYPSLSSIQEKVDTITVYLNNSRTRSMLNDFIRLAPRRVIFNPGTESDELEAALKDAGIDVLRACTLVLLSVGKY